WARFAGMSNDPAKATAACVYLWARDPSLCDAAAVAGRGFDSSRSQPAEVAHRVGMSVLSTRHPVWLGVRATAKLAGRDACGYGLEVAEQDRPRSLPPDANADPAGERASCTQALRRRGKRARGGSAIDRAPRCRRPLAADSRSYSSARAPIPRYDLRLPDERP